MARAALNWTVPDLAEATGLHRNTITNLEIGRYAGDPETWRSLKKRFVRQASNSSTRTAAVRAYDSVRANGRNDQI